MGYAPQISHNTSGISRNFSAFSRNFSGTEFLRYVFEFLRCNSRNFLRDTCSI